MKALCWLGTNRVAVEDVADPRILNPRDAVVKITTENFTATHAFTPVATLLAQVAASAIGLIPGYALDPGLVPAMATVIGGVLLMLYAARRR